MTLNLNLIQFTTLKGNFSRIFASMNDLASEKNKLLIMIIEKMEGINKTIVKLTNYKQCGNQINIRKTNRISRKSTPIIASTNYKKHVTSQI